MNVWSLLKLKTQHFLETAILNKIKIEKSEKHKNSLFWTSVASWCSVCFCDVGSGLMCTLTKRPVQILTHRTTQKHV